MPSYKSLAIPTKYGTINLVINKDVEQEIVMKFSEVKPGQKFWTENYLFVKTERLLTVSGHFPANAIRLKTGLSYYFSQNEEVELTGNRLYKG